MKMKFSLFATAAALVLTSMSASATIGTTSSPDLLFVAYDPLTGSTYTRDLGVSLSALGTSQTFSAPAGSIFGTQLAPATAAGNPIQWNVFALDNTTNAQNIYMTSDIDLQQGLQNSDVIQISGGLTGQLGGLTALDNPANGYAKPNGEYTGSSNPADVTNGYTLATTFTFGVVDPGAKGVGSSQNFLKVGTDGTSSQLFLNSSLAAFGDGSNAKGGYFTLLDAQGDLKWTNGSVAAVPLPGAAALFVPGLLAMFGIGRRRNQQAAA